MKKKLFLFTLLLSFCSCSPKNRVEGYILKGKSINLNDGTRIELYDVMSNSVIDSTTIEKNEFEFKGKLLNSPIPVYITVNELHQYLWLWLENKSMIIEGSGSDLSKSKVIGSSVQDSAVQLFKKMDSVPENSEAIAMKFVLENPNSIISASMLLGYSKSWGKYKVEELFNQLSTKNQESIFGVEIKKFIEFNRIIQIGDEYADFEMKNEERKMIRLSDNLGKVTLLEFWASNCGPCRKENPNLVRTYERFNKSGFKIFAVSLDRDEYAWKKAIEKDNLNWTHVSDLELSNRAGLMYGVNGIPDNFLIDENGEIIGRDLHGEDLNSELEKLLN